MFSVYNRMGELQVGNRPHTELPSSMFNMEDGKYYQWTPVVNEGVMSGYWKEVSAPTSDTNGYMNVNGKWYQWTPTTSGGVVTGYWNEIAGPDKIYNPVDQKYYRWILSVVDGVMTGYWDEVL